ncbi:hypothetical protein D9M68_973750 [compost metagenome]
MIFEEILGIETYASFLVGELLSEAQGIMPPAALLSLSNHAVTPHKPETLNLPAFFQRDLAHHPAVKIPSF